VQGKHHKGHKHEESKGKWRNKVKKISELLTVMDKMQAPGGLPFVNAQDISACEDLLEAYFMQVGNFHKCLQTLPDTCRLAISTNVSKPFLTLGFCPKMLLRVKCVSSAAYLTSAYISLQQVVLHVRSGSLYLQMVSPAIACQLPYLVSNPVYCPSLSCLMGGRVGASMSQKGLLAVLSGVQSLFPFQGRCVCRWTSC